jgi:hypothetical protein
MGRRTTHAFGRDDSRRGKELVLSRLILTSWDIHTRLMLWLLWHSPWKIELRVLGSLLLLLGLLL